MEIVNEAAPDEAQSAAACSFRELEIEASEPCLAQRPPKLSLASIETRPDLFQPRALSERHVHELTSAIKTGRSLPPLDVFQVGWKVVLLDGHHRREAYVRAKVSTPIPVSYFEGTLGDAVLFSAKANSAAKLAMSMAERQDAAWRYVVLGRFTKAQIHESANVADGQVAHMRRVRKLLGQEADACKSWRQARLKAQGKDQGQMTQAEHEAHLQAMADGWADRLLKTFGNKLSTNPEIAAMAFEAHFGRKLRVLVRHLEEIVGDDPFDEVDNGDF